MITRRWWRHSHIDIGEELEGAIDVEEEEPPANFYHAICLPVVRWNAWLLFCNWLLQFYMYLWLYRSIYTWFASRSFPSFRERRPELNWITIQVNLGHAEALYSSFQEVLKNDVSRSSFPFLDPVDPGTQWLWVPLRRRDDSSRSSFRSSGSGTFQNFLVLGSVGSLNLRLELGRRGRICPSIEVQDRSGTSMPDCQHRHPRHLQLRTYFTDYASDSTSYRLLLRT
jgi:hypothetical protein